ncbi:hypothetical protein E1193_01055 [Micromonospora sp. KC606]|nr:hypothetical protein E1193_01055 [Micromonospora sp. KC606]
MVGRSRRRRSCWPVSGSEPVVGDYAADVGGHRRVRVQGDLYHPVVPPGAVYVGLRTRAPTPGKNWNGRWPSQPRCRTSGCPG